MVQSEGAKILMHETISFSAQLKERTDRVVDGHQPLLAVDDQESVAGLLVQEQLRHRQTENKRLDEPGRARKFPDEMSLKLRDPDGAAVDRLPSVTRLKSFGEAVMSYWSIRRRGSRERAQREDLRVERLGVPELREIQADGRRLDSPAAVGRIG